MKKKNYILIIFIMCICLIKIPNVYAEYQNKSLQELTDLFDGKVISEDDAIHNNLYDYFDYYYIRKDSDILGYSARGTPGWSKYKCIYELSPNQNYCSEDAPKFWEYLFDLSKYWKIVDIEEGWYGNKGMYIEPYSYIEPTYEITCDPKEIEVGQTSNCSLKVNYYSRINSLTFKLESMDYTIENVTSGEDWENLETNNNEYSLTGKETIVDSEEGKTSTIINFSVKANNNTTINNLDNIRVTDLNYVDILFENQPKKVTTIVKQKENEKSIFNPKTSNNLIIVGILLSVILLSIVINIIRNKKISIK